MYHLTSGKFGKRRLNSRIGLQFNPKQMVFKQPSFGTDLVALARLQIYTHLTHQIQL
jgi:hypothetical protein